MNAERGGLMDKKEAKRVLEELTSRVEKHLDWEPLERLVIRYIDRISRVKYSEKIVVKKAVGYDRVSSKEQQRGWSPETQKEDVEHYLEKEGVEFVRHFHEDAESAATIEKRSTYQEMWEFVRNNPDIDAIVAARNDRIHRNSLNALLFLKLLERHGKAYRAVNDLSDTSNAANRMLTRIKFCMDEHYIDDLSEKVHKGHVKSEGLYWKGPHYLPFWDTDFENEWVKSEKYGGLIVPTKALFDAEIAHESGVGADALARKYQLTPTTVRNSLAKVAKWNDAKQIDAKEIEDRFMGFLLSKDTTVKGPQLPKGPNKKKLQKARQVLTEDRRVLIETGKPLYKTYKAIMEAASIAYTTFRQWEKMGLIDLSYRRDLSSF